MRVAGVNLVAVLAAAVAMYFVGFIFYGLLFQEVWSQQTLENHGLAPAGGAASLTGDALMAEMQRIPGAMEMGPAMGLGFVISLITALGLAMVLRLAKPQSLMSALRVGMIAWVGFAATTLAYNVVYSSESRIIFGIDLLHLFIAYLAGSAVIFLVDGKTMRSAAPAAA
jgi:hypothetical protein